MIIYKSTCRLRKTCFFASLYICISDTKANGSTTSTIVRKLGTLEHLLAEHGPTRDDVLAWAKNELRRRIQAQGFVPLYRWNTITDSLHEVCGFRTDYQFIIKSKMRTIQKKSKRKE